jgi:hypothetical protein
LITDGGFGGAAVKRISEGKEPDAYFSASIILRLAFTILVVLLLLWFKNYFVELNYSNMFVWLLLSLLVSMIAVAISSRVAYFRSRQYISDMRLQVWLEVWWLEY